MRPAAPLLLQVLLAILIGVYARPALASNGLNRCIGSDGTSIFTDQKCEDIGAVQRIDPPPSHNVKISADTRQTILDGLKQAASQPGGTSADVFAGFQYEVHGKTGTAERPNQLDQSWYAAYAPSPNGARPIVIVMTIEQGGFGAQAAAPAVRLMLSQWFGVKKKLVIGMSATR